MDNHHGAVQPVSVPSGYPTVKLLCNAMSLTLFSVFCKFWLSVLAPRPLFVFARARHVASQRFFGRSFVELSSHQPHTKQPWRDGRFRALQGNRRELISDQHVYLDPIATAQRLICGDFNVSS
eukprot:scaffold11080_cov70-Skeletonema_dohrnii-CCMP3373.AAC.1